MEFFMTDIKLHITSLKDPHRDPGFSSGLYWKFSKLTHSHLLLLDIWTIPKESQG